MESDSLSMVFPVVVAGVAVGTPLVVFTLDRVLRCMHHRAGYGSKDVASSRGRPGRTLPTAAPLPPPPLGSSYKWQSSESPAIPQRKGAKRGSTQSPGSRASTPAHMQLSSGSATPSPFGAHMVNLAVPSLCTQGSLPGSGPPPISRDVSAAGSHASSSTSIASQSRWDQKCSSFI